MLDIKSKLVLKILQKECPNGSYNLVESKDIISAMPIKYRVDGDGLDNILIYLERQEYISIKYDDEGVYCLCVLPFGNEIIETESKQKSEGKFPRPWIVFILAMLSSFVGSFLCHLLVNLL
ncbi:MAG: hypothetical protein IJX25_03165 [Clostridia bacterium]|nr:hypothetical protein [Clostridia bacterium]MBQ8793011.1 hypothetical protein [Clostridia bacterium]